MAAATAADGEVLKIALPPQRFVGAVDFAESILHIIWAIFAQLGRALHEYSRPVMQFNRTSTALAMEFSSMFLLKMRGTGACP